MIPNQEIEEREKMKEEYLLDRGIMGMPGKYIVEFDEAAITQSRRKWSELTKLKNKYDPECQRSVMSYYSSVMPGMNKTRLRIMKSGVEARRSQHNISPKRTRLRNDHIFNNFSLKSGGRI